MRMFEYSMLSQKSLKPSSFFKSSLSFLCCSGWLISTSLFSRSLIRSSVLANLLSILSNVCFLLLLLLELLYSSCLLGSFLYFLTVEVLPKFCYSLKFGEDPYDHFFEFFRRQITFSIFFGFLSGDISYAFI